MYKKAKILSYFEVSKGLDWKKNWGDINFVRKTKGKRGNLSKFILKDRVSH